MTKTLLLMALLLVVFAIPAAATQQDVAQRSVSTIPDDSDEGYWTSMKL